MLSVMALRRRSRRARLSLLVALALAAAGLVLGLGGLDVALLDLAPFVGLAVLTLVWPEAGATLIEAIRRRRPRRRGRRALAPRRAPRALRGAGRVLAPALGARAPPALLASA
jgi:hypothetical protein